MGGNLKSLVCPSAMAGEAMIVRAIPQVAITPAVFSRIELDKESFSTFCAFIDVARRGNDDDGVAGAKPSTDPTKNMRNAANLNVRNIMM